MIELDITGILQFWDREILVSTRVKLWCPALDRVPFQYFVKKLAMSSMLLSFLLYLSFSLFHLSSVIHPSICLSFSCFFLCLSSFFCHSPIFHSYVFHSSLFISFSIIFNLSTWDQMQFSDSKMSTHLWSDILTFFRLYSWCME
jgi:hypothetical protein